MVPADIVSGIGHGSSLAGARALDHSFPADTRDPMGRAHVHGFEPLMRHPFSQAFPTKKLAKGGHDDGMTDILASVDEYLIGPHAIVRKYGSLKNGHQVLDAWVNNRRRRTIKEMKALKPPVGSKQKKTHHDK